MWVRARALGAYLAVYQGGTALGSLLWGAAAARLGEPLAMGLAAGLHWHLADSEKQDLRPWNVSVPKLLVEGQLEEGPIIVQIEYCVAPNAVQDFLRAMQDVRLMRERNGAFGWLLSRNRGDEERHIEAFLAETWADYLRQLGRMTHADHAIEDRARSFHQGSASPPVTTFIA